MCLSKLPLSLSANASLLVCCLRSVSNFPYLPFQRRDAGEMKKLCELQASGQLLLSVRYGVEKHAFTPARFKNKPEDDGVSHWSGWDRRCPLLSGEETSQELLLTFSNAHFAVCREDLTRV